jgi:DNA-binding transcriptional LysR family regulator
MFDPRAVSLRQLRALAATVKHGSVTAAARELLVTPPAITAQLKSLEAWAGGALFDRDLGGFTPSDVGRELLEAALEIDHQVGRVAERLTALREGSAGHVVFGVVSSGKYLAPRIVAEFQRRHPAIRVKLLVGNRGEIVRGLERNGFDLALMGQPPAHVPLSSVVLADHPHVMIAAPDHPLSGDPDILVEELLRERFLAREEGSGTRTVMARFLEQIGAGRAFEVVEMGTNETIKQAVMAGLGLAIISAHTCFSELLEGKLAALDLRGLPLVRQWRLTHRADRRLRPAAEIMKAFVFENRQSLFPRLAAG